jgi:hypothetical protein
VESISVYRCEAVHSIYFVSVDTADLHFSEASQFSEEVECAYIEEQNRLQYDCLLNHFKHE